MKKVNGLYFPSKTDIEKAKSHTRAIARKQNGSYDGYVGCYFDRTDGKFRYEEFVGRGYFETDDNFIFVCGYDVHSC